MSEPPGGRENKLVTVVTARVERLAVAMDAPGGDDEAGRMAVWWCPPGSSGTVRELQARGAWRCGMPAKRSEAKFRLAA